MKYAFEKFGKMTNEIMEVKNILDDINQLKLSFNNPHLEYKKIFEIPDENRSNEMRIIDLIITTDVRIENAKKRIKELIEKAEHKLCCINDSVSMVIESIISHYEHKFEEFVKDNLME